MKVVIMKVKKSIHNRYISIYISSIAIFSSMSYAQVIEEPYQLPYTQAYVPIPNMLFSISVEFPTGNSAAYRSKTFDPSFNYQGYFQPEFCYRYFVAEKYFYPVRRMAGGTCSGLWSGRLLNWASMGVIDGVRSVLTGGNRIVDTINTTMLRRMWFDGRGSYRFEDGPDGAEYALFRDKIIPANIVESHTGLDSRANKSYIIANHDPVRYKMAGRSLSPDVTIGDQFRAIREDSGLSETPYFRVVVKVCSNPALLESFCQRYPSGYYKPVGLLQKYAKKSRFGVFSYPNIDWPGSNDNTPQGGGVMRAPLKSLGQQSFTGSSWVTNSSPEWNEVTGQFAANPDGNTNAGSDSKSGVINYINQFGYMPNAKGWHYKFADPLAELYYESLRYLASNYSSGGGFGMLPYYQGLGNVNNDDIKMTEGFPMILNNWREPLINKCSKNTIVFLGDANGNCDIRVPGGQDGDATVCKDHNQSGLNPPVGKALSNGAVSSLNVTQMLDEMHHYENINFYPFSHSNEDWKKIACPGEAGVGRGCWGYTSLNIAGLAYWAHSRDIRPDLSGNQIVDSYFLDVLETPGRIQDGTGDFIAGKDPTYYWYAAKYGAYDLEIAKQNDIANPNSRGRISATGPTVPAWDANEDGVPDGWFGGGSPEMLRKSLSDIFLKATSQSSQVTANVEGESEQWSNNNKIFFPFNYVRNGIWAGDLLAILGGVGSDQSLRNADGTLRATPLWSANQRLDRFFADTVAPGGKITSAGAERASPSRVIVAGSFTGVGAKAFRWGSLANSDKALLDEGDGLGSSRLAYLRGDYRKEQRFGGVFRDRLQGRMGGIINSAPLYVGAPDEGYSDSDFSSGTPSFKAFSSILRQGIVYAGADDGMLHAFNADNGDELFAYIPGMVMDKLSMLTKTSENYVHQLYVDGDATAASLVVGTDWKTALVGTLGAGGRGFYILDVTDPRIFSSLESRPERLIKLEVSKNTPVIGSVIGYMLNKPSKNSRNNVSYAMGRAKWADGGVRTSLFLGNGYGTNAVALIVVDIERVMERAAGANAAWDPTLIQVIRVPSNGGASWNPTLPNGLSSPTAIDTNYDGVVDAVYAGDLQGNLWKFDLTQRSHLWTLASSTLGTGIPLFRARMGGQFQPINAAPLVVEGCTTAGRLVTFGTGSVMSESLLRSGTRNTLYGVWDKALASNLPYVATARINLVPHAFSATEGEFRYSTATRVNYAVNYGWFLDLDEAAASAASERVIHTPVMYEGKVLFATYIPSSFSDSCDAQQGKGSMVALDVCHGSYPSNPFFDTNHDSSVTTADHASWGGTVYASSKKYSGPVTLGKILNKSTYTDPVNRTGKKTVCQLINSMESTTVGCSPMARRRASWREIRQKAQ